SRIPTDAEIAERAETTVHDLHLARAARRSPCSLNEPLSTNWEGLVITYEYVLADPYANTEEEALGEEIREEEAAELHEIMRTKLSPQERAVVHWKVGLDGCQELRGSEIAAKLGVSESTVGNLWKRALVKIRAALASVQERDAA